VAIGVGTVMTVEDVTRACDEGASFIVSPIVDPDVIGAALDLGLAPVPGAFTPTEAVMASRLGAPAIKLFPADALGPAFVAGVRAPLPDLKFVPTGGVTLDLAREFARAGAWAVGVGSPLLSAFGAGDGDRDSDGDRNALTARAAEFVRAMRPHLSSTYPTRPAASA
jgi:2-dehydro-3-deoxyphosphogluconate aldolase/(4S)-4-hydroxy-2-oxoglutarate aldolase